MKAWLRNRYAAYTPDGKFWLAIGTACLVVDMAIGYLAGISVGTFWHGVGYAALAAGFAFLPDAAYEEYEHKRLASAIVMGLLCVPIGIKAYEQQLTYSTGVRQGEMQATGVQNTKYAGAQDAVNDDKANVDLWRKQLAALLEQNAWAGTVKADGLKVELKTLTDRIEDEKKGKRGRKAGCGNECERLQNEVSALNVRIATAEQASDLTKRIEATQRILDGKREIAAKTEHKQSLNVDIAQTTARLFKLVSGAAPNDAINPDDVAVQYATLGSAGLGSLALLILAPVGFFLAGRRRVSTHPPVSDLGNRNTEERAYPITDINPPRETEPRVNLVKVTQGDINREKLRALLANLPSRMEAKAA